MEFESPQALLSRLKIRREEFCQRLLTILILEAPYPSWNSRNRPSTRGEKFLAELYRLSFDAPWPGEAAFIDELELPPRNEDAEGCGPDYAVLWPKRLWMTELKTEAKSHRPSQIPSYFEYAHFYYPDCSIDLTYLTPPLRTSFATTEPWARFSHVTWDQTEELIRRLWGESPIASQRLIAQVLLNTLAQLLEENPTAWRARLLGDDAEKEARERELHELVIDPLGEALRLADKTATDGRQRALDFRATELQELLHLRLEVRQKLCGEPLGSLRRHIRPWLWRPESRGNALTTSGSETGYELRLSRYANDVC
jgi:hypothetical protein